MSGISYEQECDLHSQLQVQAALHRVEGRTYEA